jgi:aerobic-type carbon monoxide dehydrogenase small subunit (CoxS/CutS family)
MASDCRSLTILTLLPAAESCGVSRIFARGRNVVTIQGENQKKFSLGEDQRFQTGRPLLRFSDGN